MEIPKLNQELSNTLYQYMKKEHLDTHNEITNDEWEDFIDEYQNYFAERSSELACELFAEFLIIKDKEKQWFMTIGETTITT